MSDSQAYEEVSDASDGVTVVKRFEEDEFPVPAIAFEFSSERDESVVVRLRDSVPDSVEVEDLGFHPEYGSEYWAIDEDEIVFERELDAGSGYTTVYGIRATGTDDVEKFLTRPEIVQVDPPLPGDESETAAAANDGGEDVIPESDDDVVRDVISGESDEVPGLEDEETDEEIETLDLKDPNDDGTAAAESTADTETAESDDTADDSSSEDSPDESTDHDAAETEDLSLDGDSLVTALATELRENEVSAEDVKLLRQAFEIAGQEGGSIQARVERIQSDIANLRAYTDAMEEFLDENGTAQQLVEDFESDIETLETTVESLETTVEDNDEQVSAISTEVSSLGDDVAEVSDEIASVSDEVSGVEETVDDVEGTVGELESALEDVEQSVADLEGQVTDEDVAERISDIESELDDLQTWQDQIKETFGG